MNRRGEAAIAELEQQVGDQVRAIRRARRLTQREVADLANVSLGAVKNLESGSGVNLSTLVRVLRALGEEAWLGTLPVPRPRFNPLDLPTPPAAPGSGTDAR